MTPFRLIYENKAVAEGVVFTDKSVYVHGTDPRFGSSSFRNLEEVRKLYYYADITWKVV